MARPDNSTLKRYLRATFPATTFSVTRGRGTGYGWTHISWTDGPTSRRVTDALALVGAAPGHMDNTDYFDGERVSPRRDLSEAFELRLAELLLGGRDRVPPREQWSKGVTRAVSGGWYNLHECIYRVAGDRQQLSDERVRAQAWLWAIQHGEPRAPSSVMVVVAA